MKNAQTLLWLVMSHLVKDIRDVTLCASDTDADAHRSRIQYLDV